MMSARAAIFPWPRETFILPAYAIRKRTSKIVRSTCASCASTFFPIMMMGIRKRRSPGHRSISWFGIGVNPVPENLIRAIRRYTA